ncbi:MAG: MFS transporter [Chloroflexota bacterium]
MTRSRRLLTWGLVLTTFGVALEALSILPVAPQVAADLPDGVALYGLMFAGFFLGSAIAIVISGPIVDKRGPAPVLVTGLAAFTAGLVIGGLAPTMEVLILGRLIQGAGAGMVNAVSFATVALAYTPDQRPRVLALLSLAWLLPSFLGPLLGGIVAAALGWRWVFLGLAVLMPACALLVVPQVLGLPRTDGGPTSGLRAVWRTVLPPRGQVRTAAGVILLASMAVLAAVSFAPLALSDIRDLSSIEAGVTIAILSVCWTIATFVQGRYRHVPTKRAVRVGLALLLSGLPLVGATTIPSVPMPLTWIGWALCGLGAGLTFQAANLHVMAAAEPGGEGRATASAQFAGTAGNGVGTWLGGIVLSTALGAGIALSGALALVFTLCLSAAVVAVAATARLAATSPHPAHPRAPVEAG